MQIIAFANPASWQPAPAQAVVGLNGGSHGSEGALLKGREIHATRSHL